MLGSRYAISAEKRTENPAIYELLAQKAPSSMFDWVLNMPLQLADNNFSR